MTPPIKGWLRLASMAVVYLALGLFTATTVSAAPAKGPLRVHLNNPRYFDDGNGKAIYLTGSHTWPNFQERGASNPPPVFDFNSYLDFLDKYKHNFIRLWAWEQAFGAPWTTNDYYFHPLPYQRTGPGTASDGAPKFNLNQFNQAYFDRLRSRVIAARDRGFYVSIMLFQGWSIEKKVGFPGNPWSGHPFNAGNNINGVNGDPNFDGIGTEVHTLTVPAVTAIQEAYIKKVIETVNDLDNVLYEIANETGEFSTQWQYHMINFIKKQSAGKQQQHPVGMTFQWYGGSNNALFNSPADWISPNEVGGYKDNPPDARGKKIILTDTDHLWGEGGDGNWVWKSFLRGMHPIFMDDIDKQDNWRLDARKAMGYTLAYAEKMNLATMTPQNSLASTGYCLAKVGAEYLVYQPDSGPFTVNLLAGRYAVEWFNPHTGLTTLGESVSFGGNKSFTPPHHGMAVLYLKKVKG